MRRPKHDIYSYIPICTLYVGLDFEPAQFANPINYADQKGFDTTFGPEMEAIATLEELLEQGQEFIHILYTFRSVARAVPLVRNQDDANRSQLHHETFKVGSAFLPLYHRRQRTNALCEGRITVLGGWVTLTHAATLISTLTSTSVSVTVATTLTLTNRFPSQIRTSIRPDLDPTPSLIRCYGRRSSNSYESWTFKITSSKFSAPRY